MKFKKGKSGNPDGRPPGIPDKWTVFRELLEPHAADLVAKVVEKARAGDTTALRICIDRLIPPMKAKDTAIVLDSCDGTLEDRGRRIVGAAMQGEITPDEAASLIQAVAAQARIVEVGELERRLAALEEKEQRRAA